MEESFLNHPCWFNKASYGLKMILVEAPGISVSYLKVSNEIYFIWHNNCVIQNNNCNNGGSDTNDTEQIYRKMH